MNLLEKWSFGRLLQYLRSDTSKTAEEIVGIFGYSAPSWLYEYENDQGMRPPLERVQRFGEVYRPHPSVFTYLLRASDYPHTDAQLNDLLPRLRHLVEEFSDPTYILNYRYQLIAWNNAFASRYDAVSPSDDTLRLPTFSRSDSALPGQVGNSGSVEPLSRAPGSPSARRTDLLRLSVGLPFFLVIFSAQSRLRRELELEDWRKFSHYYLVRFWQTTVPLIQKNWYKKINVNGEPEWLQELLKEVGELPGTVGTDFLRDSAGIREQVELNNNDPRVQLFEDFVNDSVLFWHGGTNYRLQMSELRDGRLMLFRHSPVGAL